MAGTAISIAINGGDLFGKTNQAATSWNRAVEEEENAINQAWNILDSMTGGNGEGGITNVPVTSVNVTPTSVTINKNGTTTLTAEVGPSNVTDNTVTWSTGDSQVATVDQNGAVTGVAGGTTQITATANDGSGYSASCTVTVNVPVTGLALYKSGENASTAANSISATVEAEDTLTLVPVFTPNDESNQSISWTSDDDTVATVSNQGVIEAVAAGTATITASANGGTNVTASCSVTVKAPRILVNKEVVASYVTGSPLEGKDKYGNWITIPVGFKIAEDSGDDVTQGIVIEDNDIKTDGNGNQRGNQYVWIPTGTIYTNEERTTSVTIIPGRYEFADGTSTYTNENNEEVTPTVKGTPILKQSLTNYANIVTIASNYQELSTYRAGVAAADNTGLNRTARNLSGFATSVANNHGYYIARYEASWWNGNKVQSRVSSGTSTGTNGHLWNYVTQINAARFCEGLYTGKINSDLMNSYAWDTAIVYIQTFSGDTDYSYQTSKNTGSYTANTGKNNDEVCKIHDMASNNFEWTTEYSTHQDSGYAYPCGGRGGYGNATFYTAFHRSYGANDSRIFFSFRPTLYL